MGSRRRGLTLVELALLVACLAVVFGLMVSLSRRVRAESSYELMRAVFIELEAAADAYAARLGGPPDVSPLIPAELDPLLPEHESVLQGRAAENNRQIVRAMGMPVGVDEGTVLGGLPARLFDGQRLLDPWGRPVVFVAAGRPEIGVAPGGRGFFMSAGPDGQYLTREDNLYSYEFNLPGR